MTSAEARADLQAMAAKVKYFIPQSPGSDMTMEEADAGSGPAYAKGGTAKAGAGAGLAAECDLEEATQYETWATDTSAAGDVTMQYDTTVSYASAGQPICGFDEMPAYELTITSMDIVIDIGKWVMDNYVMNLALEKGYTVVLKEAPRADMMSGVEPGPNQVAVSGPISKDGTVVGYFEVMGDDRVVIRDAAKAVIESHG